MSCTDDDHGEVDVSSDILTKDSLNVSNPSVVGKIELYDKFGIAVNDFDDLAIQGIDNQNALFTANIDSTGRFRIYDLREGVTQININKPNYVGINTLEFENTNISDTLTTIILTQKLPFSYELRDIDYSEQILTYNHVLNYDSNGESYLVGIHFVFGDSPNLTINENALNFPSSSFTNVNWITETLTVGRSLSHSSLEDAGFRVGDTVYVVLYAVANKIYRGFPELNFEIVSYNYDNPSNAGVFIIR
jgi:hypothetical protein